MQLRIKNRQVTVHTFSEWLIYKISRLIFATTDFSTFILIQSNVHVITDAGMYRQFVTVCMLILWCHCDY